MTRYSELEDLLLELFGAGELRRFILSLPDGDRLGPRLPGVVVSPAELTHQTVQLLRREGLLSSDDLWRAIVEARPGQRAKIQPVLAKFVDRSTHQGPTPDKPSAPGDEPVVRRLLFVSASPRGSARMASDLEARLVRETLNLRGRVEMIFRPAADYDTLEAALVEHRPHILHLSCHGDQAGDLFLADTRGESERIRPAMFTGLVEILRGTIELVVLNACHSHIIAEQLAPTLPAAIGMRDVLDDDAAIDFARTLYRNLAAGSTVGEAFALARNKLHKHGAEQFPQLFQR